MRTTLFAATAVGLALGASLAHAGNLEPLSEPPVITAPAAPPAPALHDWSGGYVGLGFSYGEATHRSPQQGFWPRGSGWGLGALGGYNWQMGNTVFGVEGHISAERIRGTTDTAVGTVRSEVSGLASLRGRVGVAADRTLFFASAGPAAGTVRHNAVDAGLSERNTVYGFMVGLGVEQALGNGWNLRGDLEHYRFRSRDFDTAGPGSFPDVRSRANVARVSTVFRF